MSDNNKLRSLLGLKPVKEEELTFGQFLGRLKDQPFIAETAPSLLVRAIEASGEVEIDKVPEARRPYLRQLKQRGITSYKAFDHVRGSQRIVHRLVNHWRAAAANGYQLFQAVTLRGGPGSGKGLLANACKDVLEDAIVYVLPSCPVHENPLNLLTLLPVSSVKEIAKELGITDVVLEKMLAVAGKPCQDCWKAIMENKDPSNPPNLIDQPVHALRLSSRKFGIATWSPAPEGQGCSLYSALLRGSRGIVDMPELFTVTEPAQGEVSELDILIEATNDRSIPLAGRCSSEDAQGRAPIDAVLIGQTNLGSMNEFLKKAKDPNRYQRRIQVIDVPYITSVTEEEFAYKDHLAKMKALPHIDPMALKMAALFAVISRLPKEHEVDLVTRARMIDGEDLLVEKKSSTVKSTTSGGGMWSGMSSMTSSATKTEKQYWSVDHFLGSEDDGMYGMNLPDMLAIVSKAVDFYLKRKPQFLSSLRMIRFLRARIDEMAARATNLSEKDKEVLKNCTEFLKFARFKGDEPGLIEREYRRVLKRELLQVFAPDYSSRAEEIFAKYQLHARFYAQGLTKFPDPKNRSRSIDVDTDFLNKVDTAMGLDSWGDDRAQFRRALDAEILSKTQEHAGKVESGDPAASEALTINWKTLPKLEAGIRKMLNDEVEKQIERILSPAVFQLNEQEQKHREESLERFRALGYTGDSLEEALQYVKDFELWK